MMALRAGLSLLNLAASFGDYSLRAEAYGHHKRQIADWYTGEGEDGQDESAVRPVVFFIYGGNWQSGHRRDYRFVADTLVSLGCDVVIPDYRVFPLVRFSEIFADVCDALKQVSEKVAPDIPIYVIGHSAGAQMGALMALDRKISGSKRITGFIGLAGPYDFYGNYILVYTNSRGL